MLENQDIHVAQHRPSFSPVAQMIVKNSSAGSGTRERDVVHSLEYFLTCIGRVF